MRTVHERLAWARKQAGYQTATDGAAAVHEKLPTYIGHENGSRGFKPDKAAKYARRFGVSLEWLLTAKGDPNPGRPLSPEEPLGVPLVGHVSAGTAHFVPAGELGEVDPPEDVTPATVAVEIRGDSLGPMFDGWLVYYDDVRRPVTPDLIGRLCIVGLADGRVLIKKIQRSRTRGLFHLISQTDAPILDVEIEWAARVKSMVPR